MNAQGTLEGMIGENTHELVLDPDVLGAEAMRFLRERPCTILAASQTLPDGRRLLVCHEVLPREGCYFTDKDYAEVFSRVLEDEKGYLISCYEPDRSLENFALVNIAMAERSNGFQKLVGFVWVKNLVWQPVFYYQKTGISLGLARPIRTSPHRGYTTTGYQSPNLKLVPKED